MVGDLDRDRPTVRERPRGGPGRLERGPAPDHRAQRLPRRDVLHLLVQPGARRSRGGDRTVVVADRDDRPGRRSTTTGRHRVAGDVTRRARPRSSPSPTRPCVPWPASRPADDRAPPPRRRPGDPRREPRQPLTDAADRDMLRATGSAPAPIVLDPDWTDGLPARRPRSASTTRRFGRSSSPS